MLTALKQGVVVFLRAVVRRIKANHLLLDLPKGMFNLSYLYDRR